MQQYLELAVQPGIVMVFRTYQESVRYYNPSAYGLDNPTSLTQDIYPDGAGITAGTVTYSGFSTNTILRSYFQFN